MQFQKVSGSRVCSKFSGEKNHQCVIKGLKKGLFKDILKR